MSKAYIVYRYYDDSSPIAVFLDEKKCDEFITEKNKAWYEDDRLEKKCRECRGCKNEWDYAEDGVFLLKDICERASIGTDRYGVYCENDLHEYRQRSSDYYSKYEVDLME